MKLSELTQVTGGRLVGEDEEFHFISTDSRALKKGEVFFALQGDRFDAENFLDDIAEKALAVVVREYHADVKVKQIVVSDTTKALGVSAALFRENFANKVIAVTGSAGKTTVKGMLRDIFARQGSVVATEGNFNNHIGVPLTLWRLANQDVAVVEAGTSGRGEIALLTTFIQPDVAAVTNVSMAHYAGFGSVQAIAAEKACIYDTLGPKQVAVINLDDTFADLFISKTKSSQRIGFTVAEPDSKEVDFPVIYAHNLHRQANGAMQYDMTFDGSINNIRLSVLGSHNVGNALTAAACAYAAEAKPSSIVNGLNTFNGDPGRLQIKAAAKGAVVIDDSYNANPASMMAAIDALASHPKKTKILVLGDMAELGDKALEAHRAIGAYAQQKAVFDAVFLLGKYKDETGEPLGKLAHKYDDEASLLAALQQKLNPDTVLLVKGSRSVRMDRIVDAVVFQKEASPC